MHISGVFILNSYTVISQFWDISGLLKPPSKYQHVRLEDRKQHEMCPLIPEKEIIIIFHEETSRIHAVGNPEKVL